jgi:hypothetical protein
VHYKHYFRDQINLLIPKKIINLKKNFIIITIKIKSTKVTQQKASDSILVTAEQIRGSNEMQEVTVSYSSQVSLATHQDQVTFFFILFFI